MQHDGTFLGEYVHGGKISEDSYYRVWVRDQEYAEGELMSGLPARDDGYARKAGFRYDKSLNSDIDFTLLEVLPLAGLIMRLIYPQVVVSLRSCLYKFRPCLGCNTNGLPGIPDPVLHYPTWPIRTDSFNLLVQFLVLIITKKCHRMDPICEQNFREFPKVIWNGPFPLMLNCTTQPSGTLGTAGFVMNTIWTSGRINPLGKNIIFHLALPTEICPLMSLKQLPHLGNSPLLIQIRTFRSDIPILDYGNSPPSLSALPLFFRTPLNYPMKSFYPSEPNLKMVI